MKAGDCDEAVAYTARPSRQRPTTPNYKIALERAHARSVARALRQGARSSRREDQLEAALRRIPARAASTTRATAWRRPRSRSSSDDPRSASKPRVRGRRSSSCASARGRRRPSRCSIRPRASRSSIDFTNASIRDILNFIGNATGINVTYDREFRDRADHGATSTA